MGGMTMGAREEINSGLQQVGAGSEGEKGKARQLKTPTSSLQIMQAINRLEQGLRSDSQLGRCVTSVIKLMQRSRGAVPIDQAQKKEAVNWPPFY